MTTSTAQTLSPTTPDFCAGIDHYGAAWPEFDSYNFV